ncbi:MAG: Ig-like domain-containing protein, partial [bacterium]|nr:Ig-like domain-containing protein [bacterium]
MRLAPLLRLGHAGIILAAAFLFTGQAHPQETWYDDDTGLTFVWTTAAGSFDYYNVYLSVDEGEYYLAGQTATERFVVNGTNGSSHRVKVAAVLGGFEGPFSPESDPVVCDTVAPLAPVLLEAYEVLDERTVVVKLQSAPSDINFACYQALGGQFSDWTDTAETQSFTFTVNAESQNVLEIREKDLAGNIGPEASLTIANLSADSDSDGMPNYWELMYSPVLNPNDPGDANLDSDGDEYTNYEEYLADTDPTRADSAPPDTAPPFTSGHIPTKGATGVSIDTAISLHILDAGHGVDAASIAMTVNGASVAPTITGSASDYLVSYDPPANFTYSQTVTVTVDARDLHSPPNAMAREVYSFTTMPQPDTTPPSTYGHSPAKGAVDVPISANISFHIADAGDGVERSSIAVTVNGGAVVPTITGSASDYLVSYDPPANFGYSQTITVTVDARDLHSPPNAMARETYTFTTMAKPDETPPTTSGHVPAKGASDVPVNTAISFHVTDSGDGVDKPSIVLTVNGVRATPTITGTPADYLVAYYPTAEFPYSETIAVTIDAQDLHSPPNVMARESYTFTTMPRPDNTPPSTSGHIPAKGAVDVPIDTIISLHMKDAEDGVDRSSIVLTVNGVPVTPLITGTSADYLVSYDPPANFSYKQQVTVTIDAQDLASPPNAMPKETYSFVTMPEPDSTPPSTSGHVPAKGAVDVAVGTTISLHVKDAGDGVDRDSIAIRVNGASVVPTITGTPADYAVVYDPPTDFGYSQTVTVTVEASDLHSPPNVMPTETYTFQTVPRPDNEPPQTSGHFPAKGATDVLPETPISLHITDSGEGVDRASIAMTVNGQTVTPTITGTADDYLVTYVPALRFDYEETVAVTVDAKDLNSPANVMPTDSYSFTVMPSPDTTPPTTTGHSPQRDATDVPPNTIISLHVTDQGDGVDFSSIAVTVNGSPVVPSVTGTLADCLVVYDPPVNFAYDETVIVTVDAGDLHSPPNVMNQDRYEFTIATSPDNDPAA